MLYSPEERLYLSVVPGFTGAAAVAILAIDSGATLDGRWFQTAREEARLARSREQELPGNVTPLRRLLSPGRIIRRSARAA